MYKASASPLLAIEFISTGLPQLDRVCGGGIPLRRVSLVSGAPSLGKSTLALIVVAEAQKLGMKTLWYDAEFSAEVSQMKQCGVDLDELDLEQPEVAEEGLDVVEDYLRKNKNCLVVIDSIGGLLPRQEQEKSAGEKTIGAQASLVAKFIRKVVPLLAMNNSALICITHEFQNIMTSAIEVSGGMKLKYHTSLHIRLKPKFGVQLKQGDKTVGKVVIAQVKKTKVGATEGQEAELQFIFDSGFNAKSDIIELAKEKLFTKTGQFWFWGEEKIARGDNGLRELFKDVSFSDKVSHALA